MRPAGSAAGWIGTAIRIAASLVWLSAGVAKIPALSEFRDLVARYGVLPEALLTPFSYALPFIQVGLGIYLAAGLFVRGSSLVGTLFLAAFLAAQIQALVRGIPLECGCFGLAVKSAVGVGTLVRDLALGLPTFIMLAAPARTLSLDRKLFQAPDRFAQVFGRGSEKAQTTVR